MRQSNMSTAAEIRALVPDFIYKRGNEIFAASKLHSVRFEGPLLEKSFATCSGSNPDDKYELHISISGESSKPACQCSCPAAQKSTGSFCKHVVALLILRAKELLKFSKEQENELILSEFKHVEDRLAEDKVREYFMTGNRSLGPPLSNDTKGCVPSVDSTVTAVPEAIKSKQRRILPSWISGSHVVSVEVDPDKGKSERNFRKKTNKNDSNIQQVSMQSSTTVEAGLVVNGGKHTGFVNGRLPKISANKSCKRKSIKETSQEGDSEFMDNYGEFQCKYDLEQSVEASRGQEEEKTRLKRTRKKGKLERDATTETKPKEEDLQSDYGGDIDLTCEDLVILAKEHLGKKNAVESEFIGDSMLKNVDSIPVFKERNQISNMSTKDNDTWEIAERFKGNAQIGGEFQTPVFSSNGEKSSVENVVDDMLGLFFGPTLNKAVSGQPGQSGAIVETGAMNTNLLVPEKPDILFPCTSDSVPRPKKKTSLKDKVMMYLGQTD